MTKISSQIREKIAKDANYRCEYCLIPEKFLATTFHVDHIISLKHGGLTIIENLAYSCPHCNQNKGSDIAAFTNLEFTEISRFYNPRIDIWIHNFKFNNGLIEGISTIGISTVKILEMNQIERVILRKALAEIGYYEK